MFLIFAIYKNITTINFQLHKCTFCAGVLSGCHIEFKFCDQKIDIIGDFSFPGDGDL